MIFFTIIGILVVSITLIITLGLTGLWIYERHHTNKALKICSTMVYKWWEDEEIRTRAWGKDEAWKKTKACDELTKEAQNLKIDY